MNLENLIQQAQGLIDSLLTPEVMEKMTPEQLKLIDEAKNSVNLKGDLSEKLEMLKKYTSIFIKYEESEFDISYFCGGTSIEWDPKDQSLGGSEQAVVNLCNEWTKLGKKIAVYGKFKSETLFNGIYFINWDKFPFHKQHSVVVLWRMSGINCGLLFPIKTRKLFVDFHDNNFVFRHSYLPFTDRIDKIFFKSDFHLEE